MERRRDQRIESGFRAEMTYNGSDYMGTIENLSASGVNVLTDLHDPGVDFLPDEPIELRFEAPGGEPVVLPGMIMWASRVPPENVRHRLGVEITEKPWSKAHLFI